MSGWAIQGDSDEITGEDMPGSLTISHSKISGNPGATAASSVHSNSANLVVSFGKGVS